MNIQIVDVETVSEVYRSEAAQRPILGKYDPRLISDMLENTLGAAREPILRTVDEVDDGITAFKSGDVLIVDACKFTPERGDIVVDVDRHGAILREVADINAPTGPARGRRLAIVADEGLHSIPAGTFDVLGTVVRVIRAV